MPYNPANDPLISKGAMALSGFGRKGKAITPADNADLIPPAKLLVTSAGTLQVLPIENDDGTWVDLGTVAVGFIPPYEVRRVKLTSTATVVSIEA